MKLRKSVSQEEFSKRTVNLEDGLDALLPAIHPHVDQSSLGAVKRVKTHLPDEADRLLKGRVRIINVWRPLSRVKDWPLALCDSRTVKPDNLVTCDIVRRRRVGETYFGTYDPLQKWYYLSNQDANEVTLLKIYDSATTLSGSRCLHSSFQMTEKPGLRESLELRFLVFSDL
ncbi:hypothetical protein ACHAQI_005442 [Fusarium lateritium]